MIYFLSDAHIGSRALENPAQHQKQIADLLLSLAEDATAIYLLGDIFDYWYEYFWRKPQGYDVVLDALKNITQKGVEVHFYAGNHDLWTFGYLAKRTGVIVHKKPETVVLNGKRCFLAHGDGLGSKDKRFLFLRHVFHSPVLHFCFRLMIPALGDWFGYNWAKKSRLKEAANPCGYKGEDKEELVQFAKSKESQQLINSSPVTRHSSLVTCHSSLVPRHDYYIFGHRHIELQLELATGAQVICLGELFHLMTYAQMDEQGRVQLCDV